MWKFSKHAQIRIDERGFSSSEILQVLNEEIPSIVFPSPREETVDLYFCKINTRYILIVADRISRSVITVRQMQKKEKAAFLREIENG